MTGGVHRIRLRGPWQYQPLSQFQQSADGTFAEQTDSLPQGGTITPPLDLCQTPLGRAYRGRVRYRRRFGRPARIGPLEVIHLVVPPLTSAAEIHLNGNFLGQVRPHSAGRFDVTTQLQARNEMWIDIVSPADPMALAQHQATRDTPSVCLEIGPQAHR
jgi:hypothetical protein